MSQPTTERVTELLDHEAVNHALALATRDALLEHARIGRSVHESHGGKTVEVTPTEIFARYGFDEFGRPIAGK